MKTDWEPESQRTVINRPSTAMTTPLRVTMPTFSDSTSTRSPTSTMSTSSADREPMSSGDGTVRLRRTLQPTSARRSFGQVLWADLKGCELANRCCADRKELIATAQVGPIRVRRDLELLRSFLAGTGLTL
jgi:hypothetical protein